MIRYLFIVVFSSALLAQNSYLKVNAELDRWKQDSTLLHAGYSLTVLNNKGDKVINCNSNLGLVPASTYKIFTTAAALELLGADHRYITKLEYDGVLDTVTGVLKGNLYIKGSGDPTIESELFKTKKDTITTLDKWSQALKLKGIKSIEGSVISDASAFEEELIPSTWIWGDMGNYYGAGAGGLSYHENKYTLFYRSGTAEGDTTYIQRIFPEVEGLKVTNYVRVGGKDDNAYIYGAPYSLERYVRGTIPPGKSNYEVDGSIPDPALFCAQEFFKVLLKQDVNITGTASTTRINKLKNGRRKLLYSHVSPTVEDIVKWTNIKSHNLFAEALLKTLALKQKGFGSDELGIIELKSFLRSKGINTSGMYLADGCGLSRMNCVTTYQQALLLNKIMQQPYYKSFYNSLPVAGKSGSMAGIGAGTAAENNLRAKSGYLTRARGYCGYVTSKSGELLSFSLIVNNYDCSATEMKKKMERIMVLLAETE